MCGDDSAARRDVRRCRETKEQARVLYRALNDHQWELERQGVDDRTLRTTIKEKQRIVDAEITEYERRRALPPGEYVTHDGAQRQLAFFTYSVSAT